jgi:hypothetical protein
MKAILLKVGIYLAGIICVFIFILARFRKGDQVFEHPLIPYYGDLYKQNFINRFDTILAEPGTIRTRYYRTSKHPKINEADILFYGDSYSFIELHKSLPEIIGDRLGKKVYHENLNELGFKNNPFQSFVNYNYIKTVEPKKLIFEVGEASVYQRFIEPYPINPKAKYHTSSIYSSVNGNEADKRYTKLLQTSIITHEMYSWIATYKFDHYGYISKFTPYYTLEPNPWLFSLDIVNRTQKFKIDDQTVSRLADNILFMKDQLKDQFNVELLMVFVPARPTIYGEMAGLTNYNNLLPMLYQKLDERNIEYVDLLNPFLNSEKILYHPTDIHWNENGISLAADKVISKIN